MATAPGTQILYDLSTDESGHHGDFEGYQHLKRGDGHILLVPQPSKTDPRDPLKWPVWLKVSTFANALLYAFLGGVTGPIMAACELRSSTKDRS